MGFHKVVVLLFLTLSLATRVHGSPSHDVLKGSVICLDCAAQNDLSEIKVLVKCSNVKKIAIATTTADGTFETDLPKDTKTADSPKCLAKIVVGSSLLYTSGEKTISRVIKVQGQNYYTNSEPLNFYKSCPQENHARCAAADFGSSKTYDVPLPREFGLAPSSYYVPFVPIIGIP